MSSNSTKVLVLDFDGVIVDSNGIKDKVFYQLFCRFPEHTDTLMEYHRTYISVSRYEKFDFLLQQIGEPTNEALKEELLKDFSSIINCNAFNSCAIITKTFPKSGSGADDDDDAKR